MSHERESRDKQATYSDEIRRTAEANAGVPLGVARFNQETGITFSDWRGKIWPRWGDALQGSPIHQINCKLRTMRNCG